MADTRLEDLAVLWHTRKGFRRLRPATVDDLVSALREKGALVIERDENGELFDLGIVDSVEGAILDVVGFNWPATNLGTVALRALVSALEAPSVESLIKSESVIDLRTAASQSDPVKP